MVPLDSPKKMAHNIYNFLTKQPFFIWIVFWTSLTILVDINLFRSCIINYCQKILKLSVFENSCCKLALKNQIKARFLKKKSCKNPKIGLLQNVYIFFQNTIPEYPVFTPRDKSTTKKVYLSCNPGYCRFFQKKKPCFSHICTGSI